MKETIDGMLAAALIDTPAEKLIGKAVSPATRAILEHFALRGKLPTEGATPLTFATWQENSSKRANWSRLTGKNSKATAGNVLGTLKRVAKDAGNARAWSALNVFEPEAEAKAEAAEIDVADQFAQLALEAE